MENFPVVTHVIIMIYTAYKFIIKAQAYADLKLLNCVVTFKSRFYPANAARYDLAQPGTMRLYPPEDCISILAEDYEHMKNMIFDEKSSIEEIIDKLRRMESEINAR